MRADRHLRIYFRTCQATMSMSVAEAKALLLAVIGPAALISEPDPDEMALQFGLGPVFVSRSPVT